jgi:hypothetical protein
MKDESLTSIPLEWTSYKAGLNEDLSEYSDRLLDTNGLREIVKMIDYIRKGDSGS